MTTYNRSRARQNAELGSDHRWLHSVEIKTTLDTNVPRSNGLPRRPLALLKASVAIPAMLLLAAGAQARPIASGAAGIDMDRQNSGKLSRIIDEMNAPASDSAEKLMRAESAVPDDVSNTGIAAKKAADKPKLGTGPNADPRGAASGDSTSRPATKADEETAGPPVPSSGAAAGGGSREPATPSEQGNRTPPASPPAADAGGQTGGNAKEPAAASDQGGRATPAPPMPAASTEPADPAKVLLEQAAYWRSQSQPIRAIQSLQRLLALGSNADALSLLARAQIDAGQTAEARQTIARLRKESKDDPRIAEIEHDLEVGPPDQAQLEEARTFAQQGRSSQAVRLYRQAFKGAKPPSQYAAEYYLTLGGTPAGFEQARKELGQIVTANPRDKRVQLAYAKLLTYEEGLRDEGIKRLTKLAQSSSVGEEADKALRQAIQWLPDTSDSLDVVESYAKRHPDDTQIANKLALIRNPPLSPVEMGGKARMSGFEKMDKMLLTEAEDDFKKALSINPQDADATAGLGFLRIKQKRIDEGRELLKKAKELGPTDGEGIDATLKSLDPSNSVVVDEAKLREIKADYERVTRLTKRRHYAEAEALLRRLAGDNPDWGFYLQLGGIQALAGKVREAEASYRHALELKPGNPAATIGLAGMLLRQHREREAEKLYAQIGDTRTVGRLRAERLRSQARRVTDLVAQAGLYRAAVQADPSNPWLRLELARVLIRQGRGTEARSVMANVGGRGADEQSLEAAFYFAVEINDLQRAAAVAGRIPAGKRTPQMVAIQERVAVRAEIALATQDANRSTIRLRLLSLAAAPDPSGARVEEIARTLVALNDRPGAADAVATALASNPNPTVQQRIAYANALAGADRALEGERLLAGLDEADLPRNQRQTVRAALDGIAIAAADRLRFESRYGEAAERLSRRLERDPTSPALNMALARLYISRAELRPAVAITQELLERNPNDLEVRKAAIEALVAVGDLDRADALSTEGIQSFPRDERAYLVAAYVARRRDDNGRVIQDLRMAKQLRDARAEDASIDGGGAETVEADPLGTLPRAGQGQRVAGSDAFRPGPLARGSSGRVPNVLGDTGLAPLDPAGRRIDQEIAALQDEVAPQVRAGVGYLTRTGESGLSRLDVITAPVEASFSPGGTGILRAQVTPTLINGNTPRTDASAGLLRFGTNPLQAALGLPLGIAGEQRDTGVGLNVGYAYRFASFDVGTTPLGFLRSNVVGGVELAPLLTPEIRLRLTGDRRAVINSVLSYAGARDPATGQVWGAVVRNRGFAQLEWAPGRWFVFGGAGGGVVTGDRVQNNGFTEAIVGASYGLYENGPQQFRVGLNVPYFNYAQNQNAFTFGNGGYFSPQNYIAALPTFAWQDQPSDALNYKLQGSVGYQRFAQKAALVFPNDPSLQAALGRAAPLSGVTPGVESSGLAYGAAAEFEYKLTNEWRFGGRGAFQKAGDYTEASGVLYGRYVFDTLRR